MFRSTSMIAVLANTVLFSSITASADNEASQTIGPEKISQSTWKQGVQYDVLSNANVGASQSDKVEIIEFFWYACPHCYLLEPQLKAWIEKRKNSIHFVQVPVPSGRISTTHAQLFYTLEALGRQELHREVFDAIHKDHNPLAAKSAGDDNLKLLLEFAQRHGIATQDFTTAYRSPSVAAQVASARELAIRYQIDSVPILIVGRQYRTGLQQAGGSDKLLDLLDYLSVLHPAASRVQ